MSSQDSKATPAEQLANLKHLVAKLQSKVERLESTLATDAQAVGGAVKSAIGLGPSQTLRLVLMGPPGAGKRLTIRPNSVGRLNTTGGGGLLVPRHEGCILLLMTT